MFEAKASSASFSVTNQSLDKNSGLGPSDFPALIATMTDLIGPILSSSTTFSISDSKSSRVVIVGSTNNGQSVPGDIVQLQ